MKDSKPNNKKTHARRDIRTTSCRICGAGLTIEIRPDHHIFAVVIDGEDDCDCPFGPRFLGS